MNKYVRYLQKLQYIVTLGCFLRRKEIDFLKMAETKCLLPIRHCLHLDIDSMKVGHCYPHLQRRKQIALCRLNDFPKVIVNK